MGNLLKNHDELNNYLKLKSHNTHSYLEQLTEITKDYVHAQIEAERIAFKFSTHGVVYWMKNIKNSLSTI